MAVLVDDKDWTLMNDWQRGLPLVSRPFRLIADRLDLSEAAVIDRLKALVAEGAVSRVGATCRPNTLGASTLAAVAAPSDRIDAVAGQINAEDGVNHSYLRENQWNIWFVATGPDRAAVDQLLNRIARTTGLRVLDLRLVRAFNVDLGFSLDGNAKMTRTRADSEDVVFEAGDRKIAQSLSDGLPLIPQPFATLATQLGRTETDVLDRVRVLSDAGILSRIGVIVRHRALGWRSNAMVVWQVPEDDIARKGLALTDVPGVTLCYQRDPVPDVWPYTLYCMIHGRSRAETLDVLSNARVDAGLVGTPYKVLFSQKCFKQTGALVGDRRAAS